MSALIVDGTVATTVDCCGVAASALVIPATTTAAAGVIVGSTFFASVGPVVAASALASSFCAVFSLLNSLYSAIVVLHSLHWYLPFSTSKSPGATSSLGFSYSIFGAPSYSLSHMLHRYFDILLVSILQSGAKKRSGPPMLAFDCCSSVRAAMTYPPDPLSFFTLISELMFEFRQVGI